MLRKKHEQIFSQPQINTLFSLFKYPIHFNLSINKSYFPYVGEATVWISEVYGIKYSQIAKYCVVRAC